MAAQYLDLAGLTEYNTKIKETYTTTAITNEDIDSLVDQYSFGTNMESISEEQIDTLFA